MKINLNCREATRLVLEGEARSLTLGERLGLRSHWLICTACSRFVKQVKFMRGAMGRWKEYAEGDGTPPER